MSDDSGRNRPPMTAKEKARLEATFTDESLSPTTAPPVENPDEWIVLGNQDIKPFPATRRQFVEIYEEKGLNIIEGDLDSAQRAWDHRNDKAELDEVTVEVVPPTEP